MGKYRRLGKNTLLVIFGSAGSRLLSLLMLPFYTRWLSPNDYGVTDLISTYSSIAVVFVSCSIFDSVFIFPKGKSHSLQREYFSSALLFYVGTSLFVAILCFIVKQMSFKYDLHGFIYKYIWFIYGILITSYLQSLIQQFLRAIDMLFIYSLTGIVVTIGIITLSFILVPRWGVEGYVIAIIIGNIIGIIYSLLCGKLLNFINIKSWKLKLLKEMLLYSIPLIPNGVMWFLINALNRPILEDCCGLGGVGIFAVSSRFPSLLNTIYLLFQQAWLISVLEEADKPSYIVFYNKMLKIIFVFQSLLAVLLSVFGKVIIKLLTTVEFYSAWRYIPLLAVGVIFMNVATFVGSNFAVIKKSKYYFYSTVWAGVVSIGLNFLLIPLWGLWGACWSMIISQAVVMISRIYYSWPVVRIIDIGFYVKNLCFLFSSIFASIMLSDSCLMIPIICSCMIYFIFINKQQIIRISTLIKDFYESRFKNN